MRQTIGWASTALCGPVTFGDPTTGIRDAASSDPRKDALRDILHAWLAVFGDQWQTCRDAWTCATQPSFDEDVEARRAALHVAFSELHDDDRRKFDDKNIARWIAVHRDEVVDGLRFESHKTRENKNEWRVVDVQGTKAMQAQF